MWCQTLRVDTHIWQCGDCIGHLGQQGPEDQAAQEPLPGGDQGGGEEAGEREEGPVETTSAPGEFYIAVIVSY